MWTHAHWFILISITIAGALCVGFILTQEENRCAKKKKNSPIFLVFFAWDFFFEGAQFFVFVFVFFVDWLGETYLIQKIANSHKAHTRVHMTRRRMHTMQHILRALKFTCAHTHTHKIFEKGRFICGYLETVKYGHSILRWLILLAKMSSFKLLCYNKNHV